MPGPVSDAVVAFAGRVDAATNKIAAKLEADKQALANASTVEEVSAILDPKIAALEAVAADPANPTPPVTNV